MASMATAISATSSYVTYCLVRNSHLIPKPRSATLKTRLPRQGFVNCRKKQSLFSRSVSVSTEHSVLVDHPDDKMKMFADTKKLVSWRSKERSARKKTERFTYLVAAIMSSVGVTSLAVICVYYRFSWQMEGGEVPLLEMFGTFALSVGAAVGMEFWARWAHKALWHASLWHMHKSHHRPRDGPFELNDVFAIINAVPAIALLSYGFLNEGLVPALCFGAGLGITVFGMAYMFVHDGLVHRRFPVGPIANVPYLRRVAAAHQLHHSEKFAGVPTLWFIFGT